MDNLQVEHALSVDKFTRRCFLGVFPANGLPPGPVPWPCALVVTSRSVPSIGTNHWLAVYITPQGEGEIFDPLGRPPDHPMLRAFIRRNTVRALFCRARVQSEASTVCGHHVLYFLLHRCRGLHPDYIVDHYAADTQTNDAFVHEFIRPLLIPPADCPFI